MALQDSMYPEDWERYYDDKFQDEAKRRGYVAKSSYSPPQRVRDAAASLRLSYDFGIKSDHNDERILAEWAISVLPR